MNFKVGDKVQHVKYPISGIIVGIVYGKKVTYKIAIEVGHLFATENEITLVEN